MKAFFIALAAWLALIAPVAAQTGSSKNTTQLIVEVGQEFPDNNLGLIPPFNARQFLLDLLASTPNFSTTGTFTATQAFNGGATALTRSAGDSTTNVATTAFVQAAASAPIPPLDLTLPPATLTQGLDIQAQPAGTLGASQLCSTDSFYSIYFAINCVVARNWNLNAGADGAANVLIITNINGTATQAGTGVGSFGLVSLLDWQKDAGVTGSSIYAAVAGFGQMRPGVSPTGASFGLEGGNFNVADQAGITWPSQAQILATELDLTVSSPGLTGRAMSKYVLNDPTTSNVQGSTFDAFIYAQATNTSAFGMKDFAMIDFQFGKPIATNGCILCTNGTATIATGIDLSSVTITGEFIKSANFSVAGNGGVVTNGFYQSAGVIQIFTGTGIPAGGQVGAGFTFFSTANFGTFGGSGAPTLTAAEGSLYLRSDGVPYYNTTGSTTWDQLVGLAATQTLTNKTLAGVTVTGSFTATGLVTNADLVSPTVTVNTVACTLGGSCTVSAAASLVAGSSTITGTCSSGQILFDNAGVLGCQAASGGGNVSNTGTPTSGQLAQWTNATTIQGLAVTGTGNGVLATAPTISSLTVTTAFTATGLVTNADLANSSVTVNGTSCTLGSTCSPTAVASALVGATTTISGTCPSGQILYNNSGVLGCQAGGGSGNVSNSGSPSANQIAQWVNSTTIQGLATTGSGNAVLATAPSVSSLTVTTAFTATGLVTNADLANPSTTVNGQTCTLGSTCTVTAAANTLTGTALPGSVVGSNLTSVGTLVAVNTSGDVTATGNAHQFGSTGNTLNILDIIGPNSGVNGGAYISVVNGPANIFLLGNRSGALGTGGAYDATPVIYANGPLNIYSASTAASSLIVGTSGTAATSDSTGTIQANGGIAANAASWLDGLTVVGVLNLNALSGAGTATKYVCADSTGKVLVQTAAC